MHSKFIWSQYKLVTIISIMTSFEKAGLNK